MITNITKATTAAFLSIICCSIWSSPSGADDVAPRGGMDLVHHRPIPVPSAGSLDLMEQSLDKYNKGDFSGALTDMNQVILKDPFNPEAYFYRGLFREELGDYINAMSDFDQNRVAAFDVSILAEKGSCQAHLADFKAALTSYNKALDLHPPRSDAAGILSRRAVVKRIMHDNDGSIDDCNHALAIDKNNAEALWQRALTFCVLKKMDNAASDLQQVIKLSPHFANAHYTLAECYVSLGKTQEALTEYQRARDLFAVQHDEQGRKLATQRISQLPQSSGQQ